MPGHLPFAAIRAFDAAARHSSFKIAAGELGLTPTAVSHHIKQLEMISGRRLITRRTRSVELTPDGMEFAEAIAPALAAIGSAFTQLCIEPKRQQVTLGAGPMFASRWLVPRLADFWAAHPIIDLWLHQSPVPVWQRLAQFDLAIAWGDGQWPGIVSERLLHVDVAPVLAPRILSERRALASSADLLSLPLLHHRDKRGWQQWFAAEGCPVPAKLPGTIFEDANVLLQATLSGRGVALGAIQLIEDELAAGRLVRPFSNSIDPGDAYFLVCRSSALGNRPAATVRAWMLEA